MKENENKKALEDALNGLSSTKLEVIMKSTTTLHFYTMYLSLDRINKLIRLNKEKRKFEYLDNLYIDNGRYLVKNKKNLVESRVQFNYHMLVAISEIEKKLNEKQK